MLDAAQFLIRLAGERPEELKRAHRLTVANSLKTEDAILDTLESQIGATAAAAVRAALAG